MSEIDDKIGISTDAAGTDTIFALLNRVYTQMSPTLAKSNSVKLSAPTERTSSIAYDNTVNQLMKRFIVRGSGVVTMKVELKSAADTINTFMEVWLNGMQTVYYHGLLKAYQINYGGYANYTPHAIDMHLAGQVTVVDVYLRNGTSPQGVSGGIRNGSVRNVTICYDEIVGNTSVITN